MAELRAHNFDFGRLSNEIAVRDAQLVSEVPVANLPVDVLLQWAPPEGGYHGALNHVVIHGRDVTVPLGVARRPPVETMRVVLDDSREVVVDWSFGSGSVMRGAAGDLASVLCGRTIPPGRLEGQPL
jgi:hypothetical protein